MIFVWAVLLNALFFLGEYVIRNLIFQILAFMLVYPVGSIAMFFKYGKGHGHKWYVYVSVILITLTEYVFVPVFYEIVPNVLAETIICLVFGTGIGGCFFEKTTVVKKKKKGEPYKKILDD